MSPARLRKFQGNFSEIITTSERVRTKFLSRQMNSPSSQIVHNKLASQLLCRLLDWRKWNELKLAAVSGILPSVISAHLTGQRPMRPQHLAAYLRVLDRQERGALLDAWLQDNGMARRSRIYSTALRPIRCGQPKRIDAECSIGGRWRSREILGSEYLPSFSQQSCQTSFGTLMTGEHDRRSIPRLACGEGLWSIYSR